LSKESNVPGGNFSKASSDGANREKGPGWFKASPKPAASTAANNFVKQPASLITSATLASNAVLARSARGKPVLSSALATTREIRRAKNRIGIV